MIYFEFLGLFYKTCLALLGEYDVIFSAQILDQRQKLSRVDFFSKLIASLEIEIHFNIVVLLHICRATLIK